MWRITLLTFVIITAARAWDQVNGDRHYACLLFLIEHVFVHHTPTVLCCVCSVMEDCLFGSTERELGEKTLCDLMLAKCNEEIRVV